MSKSAHYQRHLYNTILISQLMDNEDRMIQIALIAFPECNPRNVLKDVPTLFPGRLLDEEYCTRRK